MPENPILRKMHILRARNSPGRIWGFSRPGNFGAFSGPSKMDPKKGPFLTPFWTPKNDPFFTPFFDPFFGVIPFNEWVGISP